MSENTSPNTALSAPRQKRRYFHGRLNFEQQKKQAKELLKSLRKGDAAAAARFAAHHPQSTAKTTPQLADAQSVIARENGFTSWPKMKAHCDALALAKKQIESGTVPARDTPRTVHIRCGSDIKHGLDIAGFKGAFLEFADPYCQGPVPDLPLPEFLEIRAAFISQSYDITLKDALARQQKEYAAITAFSGYDQLVLWFEHDAYDQFILAFLLETLAAVKLPEKYEIICVDNVPGVPDFVGLGQLSPEALQYLWEHERRPVTAEMTALGKKVWQAYRKADFETLHRIAQNTTPAIPQMAGAILRQLMELPSAQNGLSLTQQLTLEILAEHGTLKGGRLFGILTTEKEPLPFLGDLMFRDVLDHMMQAEQPLFDSTDKTAPWHEQELRLNETGKKLLQNDLDFLALSPPPRWVGGCEIRADQPCPRWDHEEQGIITTV
ncbi:MAG: DUF1835 domain-containing protein [Pseudomonadota bacterium]|nr:DUF1835 domain-containing protein [Pseudomonadota bacterium]QKK04639.1 MAG: DUF1835 domain-containing protein [Pseudomonadota bacterium]